MHKPLEHRSSQITQLHRSQSFDRHLFSHIMFTIIISLVNTLKLFPQSHLMHKSRSAERDNGHYLLHTGLLSCVHCAGDNVSHRRTFLPAGLQERDQKKPSTGRVHRLIYAARMASGFMQISEQYRWTAVRIMNFHFRFLAALFSDGHCVDGDLRPRRRSGDQIAADWCGVLDFWDFRWWVLFVLGFVFVDCSGVDLGWWVVVIRKAFFFYGNPTFF